MNNNFNHGASPCVSVVLPTYNGARWLTQSITSVIEQTMTDWELIIVNDCSTDDTAQIAATFAQRDPRITLINNSENKKLPASLNVGFNAARGKYLTWTSDDNFFLPDALAKMTEYLDKHPDADMVSMDMDYIDENDKFIYRHSDKYCGNRVPQYLLFGCNIGGAFMYRAAIAQRIGQYDTNTFCAEDYDYWCRIALAGNIEYANDNIYRYRTNPNSLTATRQKTIAAKTQCIQIKYAPQFFARFKYTWHDRAKFYAQTKQWGGIKYAWFVALIRIKKTFVNIALLPLFWNHKLRRKLRHYFLSNNKYSFSNTKEDIQ